MGGVPVWVGASSQHPQCTGDGVAARRPAAAIGDLQTAGVAWTTDYSSDGGVPVWVGSSGQHPQCTVDGVQWRMAEAYTLYWADT